MLLWLRNRITIKIVVALISLLVVIMCGFTFFMVERRSRAIEEMVFVQARTMALTGAKVMERVLEDALLGDAFSREALFDTDYRLITEGPLAGAAIPKYHTDYDAFLDGKIAAIQDALVEEDDKVDFAVLVDRNGYLPTHNRRYSAPLTGDPDRDRVGNRTKRIFDDPVGLAAARFEGEDGRKVLRQIYKRDTGETMWDVSAPVFVQGEHWGAFRIGLSIRQTEEALAELRNTLILTMALMLALVSLTVYLVVARLTRSLKGVAAVAEKISSGELDSEIEFRSVDEVGTLAASFNKMIRNLRQTTVSRDYVDQILASMQDSLMVVSSEGTILSANRATCALLGCSEQELLGRPVHEIAILEAEERVCWLDNRQANGERHFEETYYLDGRGEKIPVSLSRAAMDDDTGGSPEMIWIARDITQRREYERQIKKANDFLESVLNGISDALCIIEAKDLSIVGANQAFLQRFDGKIDSIFGKHCYEVTHGLHEPCDSPEDPCPVQEMLANGRGHTIEHRHFNSEGGERYVEISVSPIRNERGEITKVVHVERDITARKRAEQKLREAYSELKASQSIILQQEKMASIGQLAAGVAHEVNNPVGFISSNLNTLLKYMDKLSGFISAQEQLVRTLSEAGAVEEMAALRKRFRVDYLLEDTPTLIEESLEGAERVKAIVQNLKSFSRVDETDSGLADFNELLESTINIVWNEIKYKATLIRDFGELPLVKCQPQQLNQVFMNLLVNAVQAIEKQGEITVRTRHDEGRILVSISDTGCGIAETHRERIFEPFFTTKEVGKGTGLGMSIAYDIVKKHEGTISLTSEVGRGTTFDISIPAVEE